MSKIVDSKTVSKMLNIDRIALHYVRNSGLIPFTQVGRQIFYDKEKIEKAKAFVDKLNNEM